MKTLGVGMAGYGFIGKVHTLSYLNMPFFYKPVPVKLKMVGVCSSPVEDTKEGIVVDPGGNLKGILEHVDEFGLEVHSGTPSKIPLPS